MTLREQLLDKYTLHRCGNDRMYIVITKKKFQKLTEELAPVDRISYALLDQEGYVNLILDYPFGNIIVYYPGEFQDFIPSPKLIVYDDIMTEMVKK